MQAREKKYINIPLPHSIYHYNKHMGGVDLMDALVALYHNDIKNKRWYMRIFYHFLNVLICNAWIIWKSEEKEKMDLFMFKSKVATALIFQGLAEHNRKKRGRPSLHSPPPLKKRHTVPSARRFDGGKHFPQKVAELHPHCCRDENCRRRTRYICDSCNIPLCPEYMESFHTR